MVDEGDESTPIDNNTADKTATQFARFIQFKETPNIKAVAQMLLENNEDVVLVKRRVERLRELLVELERHLGD